MDVQTLIERHTNALGGIRAVLNVRALSMRGLVTDGRHRTRPVKCWRLRPNYLRIDVEETSGTAVEAWDGSHGWVVQPDESPYPVVVWGHTAEALRRDSAFDSLLIQPENHGARVTGLGERVVSGLPVFGVRVVAQDQSQTDIYLHRHSYMIAMTESRPPLTEVNASACKCLYTDYRVVSGMLIPHYVVTLCTRNGRHETFSWEEITANPPLDPDFFQMSAAVMRR